MRFYMGEWDEKMQKEVWSASNKEVHGNYLVTVDPNIDGGDPDPGGREKFLSAYQSISRISVMGKTLSPRVWLFCSPSELKGIFQCLVSAFGSKHHGYSTTDLLSGEGLAYHPVDKTIYEICPARAEIQK